MASAAPERPQGRPITAGQARIGKMANNVVRLPSGIFVEVEKAPNSEPAQVSGYTGGIPQIVTDATGQIGQIIEEVKRSSGQSSSE